MYEWACSSWSEHPHPERLTHRLACAPAGAFVHRHCAEWRLPEAIAVPAAHLALSRPFDVRSRGMPLATDLWHEPEQRLVALQKAPVLLAIAVVCKHALRQAGGGGDTEVCTGN